MALHADQRVVIVLTILCIIVTVLHRARRAAEKRASLACVVGVIHCSGDDAWRAVSAAPLCGQVLRLSAVLRLRKGNSTIVLKLCHRW
jgi:hypothetical protein